VQSFDFVWHLFLLVLGQARNGQTVNLSPSMMADMEYWS